MGNREVEARYREAHREEINARKRLWHAENRERVNTIRREKYPKFRQSLLQTQRMKLDCPYCARTLCRAYLRRHLTGQHAIRLMAESDDQTAL